MKPEFYQNGKYLRWTPSAIECYERGCICIGCPIYSIMETQCLMKHTVLELVRLYGRPQKQQQKGKQMKIKCLIDGEIYEVIKEDEFAFEVKGIYLGFPVWISKKDCEVVDE